MLQIGRTFRAQVDDDVDNGTSGAPNQFGLGGRGILEVHAAQRALEAVMGYVALSDDGLEPVCFELILAECTSEEAASVLSFFEVDNERPTQWCLGKDHTIPPYDVSNGNCTA
jgi:hypothetical protein